MRYDMECPTCHKTFEVTCKADDRHKQICGDVSRDAYEINGWNAGADAKHCPGVLEIVISAAPTTKHPLGFTPGVISKDGTVHNANKRRPANTRRG